MIKYRWYLLYMKYGFPDAVTRTRPEIHMCGNTRFKLLSSSIMLCTFQIIKQFHSLSNLNTFPINFSKKKREARFQNGPIMYTIGEIQLIKYSKVQTTSLLR